MTTCNQGLVSASVDSSASNAGVSPNQTLHNSNSTIMQPTSENTVTWERSSSERTTMPNEIKTSLIVNYLPQSVKENDFTNLFALIGPLKSAKLMYDKESGVHFLLGYSFGYGFVEYVNPADASRAIDTYNGYRIEHKRLKVAFSRPNTEETRNTTLYIKNLPSFYDDEALANLVRPFGDIVQARVIRNPVTGNPRGIAFVIMSTRKEATEVIQCLNGQVPPEGSHPLIVKFTNQDSGKRRNRHMSVPMGRQTNSYSRRSTQMAPAQPFLPSGSGYGAPDNWGMFPQDNNPATYPLRLQEWLHFLGSTNGSQQAATTEDQSANLALYLQYVAYLEGQQQATAAAARLSSASQFPPPPGLSPFPGVIPYQAPYSAPQMSSTLPPSRRTVSFGARKARGQGDENVIYVYGLRPFATDQELHALFSPFGQVNRVDVVMDNKTNKAKGFGFVAMENYDDAVRAVQSLDGRLFNGRNLQVRFRS